VSVLKDKFKNELIEFASVMNYAKLEKAFDHKNNGSITKHELIDLIEEARISNADTSSFHKIAASLKA